MHVEATCTYVVCSFSTTMKRSADVDAAYRDLVQSVKQKLHTASGHSTIAI